MRVQVTSRDRGLAALMQRAAKMRDRAITVGVHEDDGGAAANGGDGATVVEIAEIHEFGLGVPQRSFIRDYAEQKEDAAEAEFAALARAVVAGKVELERGLDQLAQRYAGEVQARIAAGIEPELHPATIARKGSSTPLIDTGQLRSSIAGRVAR